MRGICVAPRRICIAYAAYASHMMCTPWHEWRGIKSVRWHASHMRHMPRICGICVAYTAWHAIGTQLARHCVHLAYAACAPHMRHVRRICGMCKAYSIKLTNANCFCFSCSQKQVFFLGNFSDFVTKLWLWGPQKKRCQIRNQFHINHSQY